MGKKTDTRTKSNTGEKHGILSIIKGKVIVDFPLKPLKGEWFYG